MDLKSATIYLSIYNSTKKDIINDEFSNIIDNINMLRYKLGNSIAVKYVPKIKFKLDDQFEFLDKIIRVNKK